jgi:NAD(P)-dependent dehydrogenase (short-subunit alcohol dehydrogenase family)
MSLEDRAAAEPFVEPEDIAETVAWLASDDSLAGRVVEMRGGEPRRLLDDGQ